MFGIMQALSLYYSGELDGFVVFVMLVSAILGIFLRIRVRCRVFIDSAGIHIHFKHDGHELLLPRDHFASCILKLSPHYRASSTIILSREHGLPADLWYVTCTDEFMKDSDVVKYGLEYSLERLARGKISEADLLEQPVIMLQFGDAGKTMQKFYRRFQEIWGRDTTPQ
jgi:hypothetical protein